MTSSGIRPNHITFVGLLTACSHAGLVDEGLKYFNSMKDTHGIEPKALFGYAIPAGIPAQSTWIFPAQKQIPNCQKIAFVFGPGRVFPGPIPLDPPRSTRDTTHSSLGVETIPRRRGDSAREAAAAAREAAAVATRRHPSSPAAAFSPVSSSSSSSSFTSPSRRCAGRRGRCRRGRSRRGAGRSWQRRRRRRRPRRGSPRPAMHYHLSDLYNWNRVKLRYCDGGSFAGDSEFRNGSSVIYFRGQRIWNAIITDLLRKGLDKAEKVLLSGCSAGGLATFFHCDNLEERLGGAATVKYMSDAGFFLDVDDISGNNTIRPFFGSLVALQGAQKNLNKDCLSSILYPYQCFFPQYALPNIRTPYFILNSAYDVYQFAPRLGQPNATRRFLAVEKT